VSSRRRIFRQSSTPADDYRQVERMCKLRERLVRERAALARWMTRLCRAFKAVVKRQRTFAGIEKEIIRLENSS
jgi:hypothetical protein